MELNSQECIPTTVMCVHRHATIDCWWQHLSGLKQQTGTTETTHVFCK